MANGRIVPLLAVIVLLSGCALMGAPPGEPLVFESLSRDEAGATVAISGIVHWTAVVRGGEGKRVYEFRSLQGSVELVEQRSSSPRWAWNPPRPGTFRMKVIVTDEGGGRVDSGWSSEVRVFPALTRDARIAVLPVANLSGRRVPEASVDLVLREKLSEMGLNLHDPDGIAAFMKEHRIRDTGGLDSSLARAFRDEIGVDAVLVTSVEAYYDYRPPTVGLISRLVLTGERAEVLWMDAVALDGDAYPGFLNLGLVEDPDVLLDRGAACLAESLDRSLAETAAAAAMDVSNRAYGCGPRATLVPLSHERRSSGKYRPHIAFRAPSFASNRRYRVAIVPFLNLSDRKRAGDIVALHFVDQLLRNPHFSVMEPGLVREQLLHYRMIMEAGPSIADAEILSSRFSLGVDLVLSGTVFDYQDAIGVPKVDFAVQVIEAENRRMVWSSRSHTAGGDGVLFFDFGRVFTAQRLASEMAWGTFDDFAR